MNSHAKESNDFHVLANMMVCVNEKMGNTKRYTIKSFTKRLRGKEQEDKYQGKSGNIIQ